YSFFHWGLHPWGVYATLALALAYFKFRKESPAVVSAVLEPLFGDNVKGPWGTFIDFLVVFATIFGVATSLGLGAIQISGGLSYVFGWDQKYTHSIDHYSHCYSIIYDFCNDRVEQRD